MSELAWTESLQKRARWEKSERSKCLQLQVVISTCLFAYKLKTRHIKYQFVQVRKIFSRRWSMRLISVNNIFHWVVFSFLPLSCYIHICWMKYFISSSTKQFYKVYSEYKLRSEKINPKISHSNHYQQLLCIIHGIMKMFLS